MKIGVFGGGSWGTALAFSCAKSGNEVIHWGFNGIFDGLTDLEKVQIQMPYINTTLLIDELVNLEHEESGGRIRVYEKSGARKDRYSSLSYNYYVATRIEAKVAKKKATAIGGQEFFVIRAPKASSRRGGNRYG